MYAIIRAGGKQHKVAPGDVIEVERIKASDDKVEFTPLLVVDDDGKVTAGAGELEKAKVTADVLGESKGAKVRVMKFKNKTGYRRKNGHRQIFTTLQIDDIDLGNGATKSTAKKTSSKKTANKSTAKQATPSTEQDNEE